MKKDCGNCIHNNGTGGECFCSKECIDHEHWILDEGIVEDRIKKLEDALHKTFIKLIEVCPSDLAGDKELIDVFNTAEKALGIADNV